jgi:[acyl-carrier-protein] S-malonyltransferase
MAAIIGLDDAAVAENASEASGGRGSRLVANYNAPGQVVIAGSGPALEPPWPWPRRGAPGAPCPWR